MLGKTFGTPETARRVRKPRNEDDNLTSEESSTSLGSSDKMGEQVTRSRSATLSAGLQRSIKSDSHLKNASPIRTEEVTKELSPPVIRSRAQSFDSSSLQQPHQEGDDKTRLQSGTSECRPTSIDLNVDSAQSDEHRKLVKRLSDGQLEMTSQSESALQEPASKGALKTEGGKHSANQNSSINKPRSTANRQKKKSNKPLPTPRPVQAKPSKALQQCLTERKEKEAELAITSAEQNLTDGVHTSNRDEENNNSDVETDQLHNGHSESVVTKDDTSKVHNPSRSEGSPVKKKTLPVCFNLL